MLSFPFPYPRENAYLVHIDGQRDEDVEKVSQSQASNEDIGPIPHTFVPVNDSQQGGVADDSHNEDGAGHKRIDILKGLPDLCPFGTHGCELWGVGGGISKKISRFVGGRCEIWEESISIFGIQSLQRDGTLPETVGCLAGDIKDKAGDQYKEP